MEGTGTGGGGSTPYVPRGTYNDQGLSASDQAKIQALKYQWEAANAAGHAARLALSSHVDDVRNVHASSIQTAVGLPELLAEIETYWPVAE